MIRIVVFELREVGLREHPRLAGSRREKNNYNE
jgi:hypothetical protein